MSAVKDVERVSITISAPNHRQTCLQILREEDRTPSAHCCREGGQVVASDVTEHPFLFGLPGAFCGAIRDFSYNSNTKSP